MSVERTIFRQGSTTFFISSLFFPRSIRQDVFDLYSFVRMADDYVDQVPADIEGFYRLRRKWDRAVWDTEFITDKSDADTADERVVKNMLRVLRKYKFESAWVNSFLDAMQSDIGGAKYETVTDLLNYIYGSAEVIGLMMARIMGLPPEADEAAQLQGRAFQLLNFIRDIDEDNALGRSYFPSEEIGRFGLSDMSKSVAMKNKEKFNEFVRFEINRYKKWQIEAQAGYKYIPRRLRIPLQTAREMYGWTAQCIEQNPTIVFQKKVKPSKPRVISKAIQLSFAR